jgi:hypothetical protein
MHMFMIYLHAKFQMRGSTNSLVVTMKKKAKCRFVAATIMIFYIVLKFNPPKFWIFFKVTYHTKFGDPKVQTVIVLSVKMVEC